MGIKDKIANEVKAVFWTSLYFFCWFTTLMFIKQLLLHEYKIEFYGFSVVVLGTLVAAKAVLILEKAPLFKRSQTAIAVILKRTLLYLAGVFIILVLEKSFEARHEFGGFINALKNLANDTSMYHVLVNIICVFGALFFYNLWSVIKRQLGEGVLKEILFAP
ncbi:MAG: hypothetical protein KAH64_01475, partial [Nitrosomonadaceae bacterium]|nr:hypothetical protein [Nitrosomonadaceae bacterium]